MKKKKMALQAKRRNYQEKGVNNQLYRNGMIKKRVKIIKDTEHGMIKKREEKIKVKEME